MLHHVPEFGAGVRQPLLDLLSIAVQLPPGLLQRVAQVPRRLVQGALEIEGSLVK